MIKLTFSAILAATLTACGGASSDTETKEPSEAFKQALNACGNGVAQPIYENGIVFDDDQRYVLRPAESTATVEVQDSGSIVCITDSLAGVGFSGTNGTAYVDGNAAEVIITGSGNTLVVWGDILSMEISGDNNAVFMQTVATYTNGGTGNIVQSVSGYSFDSQ